MMARGGLGCFALFGLLAANVPLHAQRQQFITVEKGVRLEVLDWGGGGRSIVMLAGFGGDAWNFNDFAPLLTSHYHVYSITRRGFGASSHPLFGYLADSLADDVLAVLDSLDLKRPVLAGHSLAGEELSSVGSRHPERVAGLVYLDAGYPYACYDSTRQNVLLTVADVQRKLARLVDVSKPTSPKEVGLVVQELLTSSLPLMERDLRMWADFLAALPHPSDPLPSQPPDPIGELVMRGQQKYTTIRAPALAIYAAPSVSRSPNITGSFTTTEADSADLAIVNPQIAAFERCARGVRVVRIAHASHFIFESNPAQVAREMRAFIDSLPPPSER